MKPEINEIAVQKADEYAKKTFEEYYESPVWSADVGDCKGYFYDGFMQGYQYARKEKCDKSGYQPDSKLNTSNPPKGGKSIKKCDCGKGKQMKPCPFCKSTDLEISYFDGEDSEGWPSQIQCCHCGCTGPWVYIPDDQYQKHKNDIEFIAILTGWNNREGKTE